MTAMPDAKRLVGRSAAVCQSRGLTAHGALYLIIQIADTITEDTPAENEAGIAWLTDIKRAALANLAALPPDLTGFAVPSAGGSGQNGKEPLQP